MKTQACNVHPDGTGTTELQEVLVNNELIFESLGERKEKKRSSSKHQQTYASRRCPSSLPFLELNHADNADGLISLLQEANLSKCKYLFEYLVNDRLPDFNFKISIFSPSLSGFIYVYIRLLTLHFHHRIQTQRQGKPLVLVLMQMVSESLQLFNMDARLLLDKCMK